ncbi:hypothetical protein [Mesorhizobium sp. M1A.F.Ca.IN.020.04.1.1]|uniref:hypothetical protein n=1 Tax=Mesorhizobium sp. M1A.F.Ca.IN.020.04.1.1 TaxID=2496761 RepID=UPI000FCA6F57|nr:hypothetical protein [Mesorhizobium sp. M1A.F.Ca.IN.020.04.1.1]RUW04016.1 hypothetical protein EOA49_00360 [Mesorhizobium sp. M1A.F.Ca.IN.020.04.1.1]RUW04079.1 hypothetical protein EOA49_00695 [Mesorhizobium sp. M1A.F.Ca.IN.020.04.1.1]
MTAAGKRMIKAAKGLRSAINMTADECRQRLEAEKRSRNCLPQDISYWQFWIDFHERGQEYAERNLRIMPVSDGEALALAADFERMEGGYVKGDG